MKRGCEVRRAGQSKRDSNPHLLDLWPGPTHALWAEMRKAPTLRSLGLQLHTACQRQVITEPGFQGSFRGVSHLALRYTIRRPNPRAARRALHRALHPPQLTVAITEAGFSYFWVVLKYSGAPRQAGAPLGVAPVAPSPDQEPCSTSANTVGTSSIMQVTRGQCAGGHLLATDCHDPKVLAGRDHSGPLPELTWEQRRSVAGNPCQSSQEKESPGIRGQLGAHAPRRHTLRLPSRLLQALVCMPDLSPLCAQHGALAWQEAA